MVATTSTSALVTRTSETLDARVIHPRPFRQSTRIVADGDSGPAADAAGAFRARRGGAWRITFDRHTGRPSLISGQGVPLLPGRGNRLTPAGLGLPGGAYDLAETEALARAFIAAEGDLLLPPGGELRINTQRSGRFDDGRIWYFDFDWYVDGIPVEGARVFLRVNHGNIVQFGASGIGRARLPATVILDAAAALERLFEHAGGRTAGDQVVEPGRLLIVPHTLQGSAIPWGAGIGYRTVWRVAFRRGGATPTWTADIDARTGAVLSFHDANRYARVTGGIYPRTVTDSEEERPFPDINVTHGGGVIDVGADASYT